MVNVGNAVSTFTAQNIGGKKPERVKEGFRAGLLMSAVIGVIVTGILLVYAKVFVGLFMDSKFQSGGDCHRHRIPACGRPVLCTDGYHEYLYRRTAGSRRHPLVLMVTLINLSSRVILAYSMSGMLGAKAIWWSIPIGWGIGFAIGFVRYLSGKWQKK